MQGYREQCDKANVLWAMSVFALAMLATLACDNRDSSYPAKDLQEAVTRSPVDEVRTLVADGADVNGSDAAGNPILLAAISRHVPTFGISVKSGQPVRYASRFLLRPERTGMPGTPTAIRFSRKRSSGMKSRSPRS